MQVFCFLARFHCRLCLFIVFPIKPVMSSESCQVGLSISSRNARASEEEALSRLISRAARARVISHDISQAPVVQKVDSAIYWINHYPVDNAIGLRITYPLDIDISGGYTCTCSSIQLLNNRGQIASLFPGYSKLSTRQTLLGLVMYPTLPFFQRCYLIRKKNVKRPLYHSNV